MPTPRALQRLSTDLAIDAVIPWNGDMVGIARNAGSDCDERDVAWATVRICRAGEWTDDDIVSDPEAACRFATESIVDHGMDENEAA